MVGACSVVDSGFGDDRSDRAAVVDRLVAPRDLLDSLQVEAAAAGVSVLGQADLLDLPVEDNAEARELTDRALAELETTMAPDDDAETAYGGALEALEGLDQLRRDVDDPALQPPGLSNNRQAEELYSRYADLASGLLDAQRAYARTVDDPDLRTGGELLGLGLQQRQWEGQLISAVLVGGVDPERMQTPEWIADVSGLLSSARDGQDELTILAANTEYEDAADDVIAAVAEAGYLEVVDDVLASGNVDVASVLAAVPAPDAGWPAFVDRVEAIVRESA